MCLNTNICKYLVKNFTYKCVISNHLKPLVAIGSTTSGVRKFNLFNLEGIYKVDLLFSITGCSEGCSICSSDDICTECGEGWYLEDDTCQRKIFKIYLIISINTINSRLMCFTRKLFSHYFKS